MSTFTNQSKSSIPAFTRQTKTVSSFVGQSKSGSGGLWNSLLPWQLSLPWQYISSGSPFANQSKTNSSFANQNKTVFGKVTATAGLYRGFGSFTYVGGEVLFAGSGPTFTNQIKS